MCSEAVRNVGDHVQVLISNGDVQVTEVPKNKEELQEMLLSIDEGANSPVGPH